MTTMLDGTVGEFDGAGGVGLIDADNGGMVFFSVADIKTSEVTSIRVGDRAQFSFREQLASMHVDELSITEPSPQPPLSL